MNYLGINQMKNVQNLYIETYKRLLREMKDLEKYTILIKSQHNTNQKPRRLSCKK